MKPYMLFILPLLTLLAACGEIVFESPWGSEGILPEPEPFSAPREVFSINDDSTYGIGLVDFALRRCPGGIPSPGYGLEGDGVIYNYSSDSITLADDPVAPFWIGETEVTNRHWLAVHNLAPVNLPDYSFFNGTQADNEDNPIASISWCDAVVFCNALSELAGLAPVYGTEYLGDYTVIKNASSLTHTQVKFIPGANGFRLLTAAEWETAARFIDGSSWTNPEWGSGQTRDGDAGLTEVAWFSPSSIQPVGTKRANALGCFDMTGNVNEWCFDLYATFRVFRGGSYYLSHYALCQTGKGSFESTDTPFTHTGLRLARNAP